MDYHAQAELYLGRDWETASLYHSRTFPLPRKRSSPLPPLPSNTEELTMEKFDYDAAAELYPSRRYAKSQQARYRRFARAADAIRYVIEEMPDKWLTGTFLEVDEQRLEGEAIRPLYEAPEYPLLRRKLAA